MKKKQQRAEQDWTRIGADDHEGWFRYFMHRARQLFETPYPDDLREGAPFDLLRDLKIRNFMIDGLSLQGRRGVYVDGPITKGMAGNYEAIKRGPVPIDGDPAHSAITVKDLDEKIGSPRNVDEVIEPNQQRMFQMARILRELYPDKPIIVPNLHEAVARLLRQYPNVLRGIKLRDALYFMAGWSRKIFRYIDTMPIWGDGHFSRSTWIEMKDGVRVAAGIEETRPQADMRIVDLTNGITYDANGQLAAMPLYKLQLLALEYLVFARQHRLLLDTEPTILAQFMALAEMGLNGQLPKANPEFLAGIHAHAQEHRRFAEAVIPFLASGIAERRAGQAQPRGIISGFVIDMHGLPEAMQAVFKKAEAGETSPQWELPQDLLSQIKLYKDVEAIRYPPPLNMSMARPQAHLPALAEPDFESDDLMQDYSRTLFARDVEKETSERDRDLIKSARKTIILPALRQDGARMLPAGVTYYIAWPDTGEAAQGIAATRGLQHPDEVRAVLGAKAFAEKVLDHEVAKIAGEQAALNAEGITYSPLDDQKVWDYDAGHKSILTAGDLALHPVARVIGRHVEMGRAASLNFRFKPGYWERDDRGVQDMVHAVKLQMGLVCGAETESHRVRIADADGKPLSFHDIIRAVWEPIKDAYDQGRADRLPEQVTALAQLWALYRLASNPALRGITLENMEEAGLHAPSPNFLNISAELMNVDRAAMEKLWTDEIKPAFLGLAADAHARKPLGLQIRARHLEFFDDFRDMRRAAISAQLGHKTGDMPMDAMVRRPGGTVPDSGHYSRFPKPDESMG